MSGVRQLRFRVEILLSWNYWNFVLFKKTEPKERCDPGQFLQKGVLLFKCFLKYRCQAHIDPMDPFRAVWVVSLLFPHHKVPNRGASEPVRSEEHTSELQSRGH